ncbi:MAG: Re/Si-specific NAD(P)(+) transhydrogenase subunit alpha, partial [Acidimicrobiales bacterium]
MKLVVPREGAAGETRVALVPAALDALALAGFEVVVEEGAGERAGFDDAAYVEHGAKVADEAGAWLGADAVA